MKTYYVYAYESAKPIAVKAGSTRVQDGVLYLRESFDGAMVATFAPGAWAYFIVEEEVSK